MKIFIIAILLIIFPLFENFAQTDTLKVFFVGHFDLKEKFFIKYNDKTVYHKIIEKGESVADSFTIVVDTTEIKNYYQLPLLIYKWNRYGSFFLLDLGLFYQSDRKYLILYKEDTDRKRHYTLNALWVDKRRYLMMRPNPLYDQ